MKISRLMKYLIFSIGFIFILEACSSDDEQEGEEGEEIEVADENDPATAMNEEGEDSLPGDNYESEESDTLAENISEEPSTEADSLEQDQDAMMEELPPELLTNTDLTSDPNLATENIDNSHLMPIETQAADEASALTEGNGAGHQDLFNPSTGYSDGQDAYTPTYSSSPSTATVWFTKQDGTSLYSQPDQSSATDGTSSQGDNLLLKVTGDWGETPMGKWIRMDAVSKRPIGRNRASQTWSNAR